MQRQRAEWLYGELDAVSTLRRAARNQLLKEARRILSINDIVSGGWALGNHRARLLDRDLEIWQDVPYGLCLFCWWPYKSALSESNRRYLLEKRWPLFAGASRSEDVRERILEVVPPGILKLETRGLFSLFQKRPIERIFRL